MTERPKVGIGVVIRKEGKVLIGERIGSTHANNTWHLAGGHLEYGEDFAACARREAAEECGLKINVRGVGCVTNDLFSEGKHYVTLFIIADYVSGEPQALEPHKCKGWGWRSWNDLPQPLMLPIENAVKQGFDPFAVFN